MRKPIQVIFPKTHWADTLKNVVLAADQIIDCEINPYAMIIDDCQVSYISTAEDSVTFQIKKDDLAQTQTDELVTLTLTTEYLEISTDQSEHAWKVSITYLCH